MNKIEIEIPVGKEVDWEASAKQKQIVLKDKQLTYQNVCDKLFDKGHYHIDSDGNIRFVNWVNKCPNNATTQHQLECILAKNKLANVARYLNGEWKPGKTDLGHFDAYVIYVTPNKDYIGYIKIQNCAQNSNVLFKSEKLAKQAIEILGEEVIKLALTPLY
jgi:hypothetical protein